MLSKSGTKVLQIMHICNKIARKVRFVKILSLCVSLSFAQFHRETTLRTPRKLPATAQSEKVLFVNIPCLYTLRLTPYTLNSSRSLNNKWRFFAIYCSVNSACLPSAALGAIQMWKSPGSAEKVYAPSAPKVRPSAKCQYAKSSAVKSK